MPERGKIAVLTGSRADFGIYQPLLRALRQTEEFDTGLVVFGAHLSPQFGDGGLEVEESGFPVMARVGGPIAGTEPADISAYMAATMAAFSEFYRAHQTDAVICLGDRYEMFAAVAAGVPFNRRFVHLHGGEKTLGAIDNAFRHSISHFSSVHFAAAEVYAERLRSLLDDPSHVHNTGALSADNILSRELLSREECGIRTGADFQGSVILMTFHPETVNFQDNEKHALEILKAVEILIGQGHTFLVTMPNADTGGLMLRRQLSDFAAGKSGMILRENLGSHLYLSCLKHCRLLFGNSSSAFIEAGVLGRKAVNLGRRQEGRLRTPHLYDSEISTKSILSVVDKALRDPEPAPESAYGRGDAAEKMLAILRKVI